MKRILAKPRLRRLEAWGSANLSRWLELMQKSLFQAAGELAVGALHELCRRNLKSEPVSYRRFHHEARVVFNGLRDLSNLKLLTSLTDWWRLSQAVEHAWSLALDAEDRLSGCGSLSQEFRNDCALIWNSVYDVVRKHYGPGIYTSWEIVFDRLTCSVCKQDIRGCNHRPGRWYGDEQCKAHVDGGTPRAVAVVDHPSDRRCRIWPWLQRGEEGEFIVLKNVPIFVVFTPEGSDDGGEVLDMNELQFRSTFARGTRMTSSLALDPTALGDPHAAGSPANVLASMCIVQ